jgi:hypothetical protein
MTRDEVLETPHRYLYFDIVMGLALSYGPERYAGGSVAAGRVSHTYYIQMIIRFGCKKEIYICFKIWSLLIDLHPVAASGNAITQITLGTQETNADFKGPSIIKAGACGSVVG